MLNPELFNEAISNLATAYQDDERSAEEIEKQITDTIRGSRILKSGETLESTRYYERMGQYIEFHRLVAQSLITTAKETGQRKFFEHAVNQTVKCLKVFSNHYNLQDLETEATVLYVERPDLSRDMDLISGGIGGVLKRSSNILDKLEIVKEKASLIFAPLTGQSLEAYSNIIIIPYGDQLVEVVSDYSPENIAGKLMGVTGCVVNSGIEDTLRLNEPLRYYPNDASKRYCICLELDQSGGRIEHSNPPKGISKNLAGLQNTFIPIRNLDNSWNGLRYSY